MERRLNIHEVAQLRGKLKATKRATTMIKRAETSAARAERTYQEQLARDIKDKL